MRVFVYRNLRKKCWSIKALEGPYKGTVIEYSEIVVLSNVYQKVSENGRQRVLRTKQKNVHAGIVGHLSNLKELPVDKLEELYYNPYTTKHFVRKNDNKMFISSSWCILNSSDNSVKVYKAKFI